jgi:peptide/nickel transport system substrate-binding protein
MDLLKRLDMKVDLVAVDGGTQLARLQQKSPPHEGGWQMSVTVYRGADCADPTNRLLRANGGESWNGWAHNPEIEAEITAWYDATSVDEEKTIVRRLNRLAVDHVLYAPLGVLLRHRAWRKQDGVAPFFCSA